jgi:hypothetical protein
VTTVYLAHLTFPFKVTCQMVGGASGHVTCATVTGHGESVNWISVDSHGHFTAGEQGHLFPFNVGRPLTAGQTVKVGSFYCTADPRGEGSPADLDCGVNLTTTHGRVSYSMIVSRLGFWLSSASG